MSKEGLVSVKYYPFGTKHYMTLLVPKNEVEIVIALNYFNKRQANRDVYIWRNTTIAKEISLIDRQATLNNNPEYLYIKNDIGEKLLLFIDKLSRIQQVVINMLLANDFNFGKVAIELDKTVMAVRRTYYRALDELKIMFVREYGYDFDFAKYINN